jgi:hypothetical protein
MAATNKRQIVLSNGVSGADNDPSEIGLAWLIRGARPVTARPGAFFLTWSYTPKNSDSAARTISKVASDKPSPRCF